MKIKLGPTGKVVRGHVFDVNEKHFVKAMQDYDKQLYIWWNPDKLNGWGCWEIRRAPNKPKKVYQGTHKGIRYYSLEYLESDMVHHILDAAFLNYDAIRKLKEMDTWKNPNWVADLDKKREEYDKAQAIKNKEDLRYNLKQHKKEIKDFKKAVSGGINPADFFSGKYKS